MGVRVPPAAQSETKDAYVSTVCYGYSKPASGSKEVALSSLNNMINVL